MSEPRPVTVPLISPNEREAVLSALFVAEGEHVAKDQPLCTLETTKAEYELTAETEGFVVGVRFGEGDLVRIGDTLCYLADRADAELPEIPSPEEPADADLEMPEGLRISRPALSLAREAGLPLSQLPIGPLITEPTVREFLSSEDSRVRVETLGSTLDPAAIVVYGGGGHGKALIELLGMLGTYRLVGVVDDHISGGQAVLGLPVLGGREVLPELHADRIRLAVNAVGGIGDVTIRREVFEVLAEADFACPAVIHPTAFVEPTATLAAGVQVMPHAYVGTEVTVGYGTIVNTGAIVSHECVLEEFVNVAPGAILAGAVTVGAATLIGMGVTVNLEVGIGPGARVGNGATVKADVPAGAVVRAGTTWPT